MECTHEYVNSENVCCHCGEKTKTKVKTNDKSIKKDVEILDLPQEIKIKAEEIYQHLNQITRRGNRRKQLIFFCVIKSYEQLGIHCDPKSIAKICGIKKSEMSKSLSAFSESQTGFRSVNKYMSAIDLIPSFCEDIGLPKGIHENIQEFSNIILAKDPELKEGFPQNLAAGIIAYYMTIQGIQFDKKEYSSDVKLSDVTIQNMIKKIAQVHNS
jgi:transcription initiation factor TFIIIB Brf1 subunit/transcription initiation factor TFIIB